MNKNINVPQSYPGTNFLEIKTFKKLLKLSDNSCADAFYSYRFHSYKFCTYAFCASTFCTLHSTLKNYFLKSCTVKFIHSALAHLPHLPYASYDYAFCAIASFILRVRILHQASRNYKFWHYTFCTFCTFAFRSYALRTNAFILSHLRIGFTQSTLMFSILIHPVRTNFAPAIPHL